MKYICKRTCQLRINDQITLVSRGDVIELDKDPGAKCFESIETEAYKLDFTKASEQELKLTKWTFNEAYKAIKAKYDVELHKEEGTKRSEVIDQILDARYRAIT